jgi:hypothetical protein
MKNSMRSNGIVKLLRLVGTPVTLRNYLILDWIGNVPRELDGEYLAQLESEVPRFRRAIRRLQNRQWKRNK